MLLATKSHKFDRQLYLSITSSVVQDLPRSPTSDMVAITSSQCAIVAILYLTILFGFERLNTRMNARIFTFIEQRSIESLLLLNNALHISLS